MSVTTCSMCGTRFSGRSDAVYCSPACRQTARRARTARRTTELRERLAAGYAPAGPGSEAARALRRSVALSLRRAQTRSIGHANRVAAPSAVCGRARRSAEHR